MAAQGDSEQRAVREPLHPQVFPGRWCPKELKCKLKLKCIKRVKQKYTKDREQEKKHFQLSNNIISILFEKDIYVLIQRDTSKNYI